MNSLALFAQAGIAGTVGYYLIIFIVIAAIVGIALLALNAFGISVPPAVIKGLWIIAVAVLAILAIKILLSML